MLREAIDYYTSKGDAQTAAHMFFLLGRQLPRTSPLPDGETSACIEVFADHYASLGFENEQSDEMIDKDILSLLQAGLQPLKVSAILTTYHENLVKMRLDNEAAILRRLAYPAFPSVYEDYMSDNQVKIDAKRQSGCPVSISKTRSAFELPICLFSTMWVVEIVEKHANTAEQICWEKGTKLWTVCLLCGHGGHLECLNVWFGEEGQSGCPNSGCLCVCVIGKKA